jgi:hypothetical protein
MTIMGPMQIALEVPRTQCKTPGGMILEEISVTYSEVSKRYLQHVSLPQMDTFKTETIGIISLIDKIGVPSGTQRVN